MNRLAEIPVKVLAAAAQPTAPGNALPILHEVAACLERLAATGEATSIDIRRIPLSGDERRILEQLLGEGEANIRIEALGKTRIRETGVPGVWWTRHCNAAQQIIGEFIEVASVPEILRADTQEMNKGLAGLRAGLAQLTLG